MIKDRGQIVAFDNDLRAPDPFGIVNFSLTPVRH
jgi:hypothetical protein